MVLNTLKKSIFERSYFLKMLLFLILSFSVFSQVSDEEHKSHHPETGSKTVQSSNENVASPKKGGMMGGMMGGNMGKMMGGKGGGMMPGCPGGNCGKSSSKTWDIYPTLMNLSELTPEKRNEIIEAANERMRDGRKLIDSGIQGLDSSSEELKYTVLENSIEEMRQGLSIFGSGVAANKAIAEGKAPNNIALRWFKREMNLIPMSLEERSHSSFFMGMSFFHTSIMAILVLFMAVMIWMYFFKMKRAALLLESLSKRSITKKESTGDIKPTEIKTNDKNAESSTIKPAKEKREKFKGLLKIIGIFEETSQVKTFRLAHIDDTSLAFDYEPGQFVTFALEIEGKKVRRAYTISSSPTEKDFIEVTIKREEKGLVSRYFHDTLSVDDQVEVIVPGGKFYFNGKEQGSIVFISGGVGITPMMSAVRYLTAKCWSGEIYFLFCARTTNDFIYQKELEYLQSRYENLNVLVSVTRAKGTSWMGPQGRFTKELISNFVPNIENKTVHICGPGPMMDAVNDMLKELGVSDKKIKTEAFGGGKPKAKEVLIEKSSQVSLPKISFEKSNKVVDISPEQTILEVAEGAGIEIENSCRSGSCGMCKIKLLSGRVSMEVDDSLEEEEKSKGVILACQAKANENVSVEV